MHLRLLTEVGRGHSDSNLIGEESTTTHEGEVVSFTDML